MLGGTAGLTGTQTYTRIEGVLNMLFTKFMQIVYKQVADMFKELAENDRENFNEMVRWVIKTPDDIPNYRYAISLTANAEWPNWVLECNRVDDNHDEFKVIKVFMSERPDPSQGCFENEVAIEVGIYHSDGVYYEIHPMILLSKNEHDRHGDAYGIRSAATHLPFWSAAIRDRIEKCVQDIKDEYHRVDAEEKYAYLYDNNEEEATMPDYGKIYGLMNKPVFNSSKLKQGDVIVITANLLPQQTIEIPFAKYNPEDGLYTAGTVRRLQAGEKIVGVIVSVTESELRVFGAWGSNDRRVGNFKIGTEQVMKKNLVIEERIRLEGDEK